MQSNVNEIETITNVHFKNERRLHEAFDYQSDDENQEFEEHENQDFEEYGQESDDDFQQRLNDAIEHLSDDDELRQYSFRQLVFLGESSLDSLITRKFMEQNETATADDIESLVKDNLDNEKLARACVDRKLDKYILYNQSKHESQLKEQIANFKTEAAAYPFNYKGMIEAPKIAADVVRSLFGAIGIDSCYDDDTMYEAFKKTCYPLFTKEEPALHPYAELYKLVEQQEIALKCEVKKTPDAKNNVRLEINNVVYEDITSDLDVEVLKNRAAFSALQKLDIQKAAKNPERAHEASSSQ